MRQQCSVLPVNHPGSLTLYLRVRHVSLPQLDIAQSESECPTMPEYSVVLLKCAC